MKPDSSAADQRVSATLADLDVARLLQIDVGAPLVKLTRVVRDSEAK